MPYVQQRVVVKHWLCQKRAFQHRRDAVKTAKRIPHAMWVYRCEACGKHHLTSSRSSTGRAF